MKPRWSSGSSTTAASASSLGVESRGSMRGSVSAAAMALRSLRAQALKRGKPARPPGGVPALDEADQRAPNRRDAGEAKDVALERADRVRAVVPAVERRRHPHRHDD